VIKAFLWLVWQPLAYWAMDLICGGLLTVRAWRIVPPRLPNRLSSLCREARAHAAASCLAWTAPISGQVVVPS